jgi:hypothetical protein
VPGGAIRRIQGKNKRGEDVMKTWMKTLALGLVLGTVACEDLGPNDNGISDRVLQAEAALVAADGMFQDLDLVQDPGLQSMGFDGIGTGPMLVGGQGNGCQAKGSGGAFQCARMHRDGFNFEREVTFLDATGNPQEGGFVQGETNAIHLLIDGEGTRERNFWTVTMSRFRDMWMTELLSDEHHLNGTGSSSIYRSGNPGEGSSRTFNMSVGVEWEDVVHRQPREENPYPLSGTVTRNVFVEATEDGEVVRSKDVETVITFDGTQLVTMYVDGEPVEIDLAERGVNGRFGRFGGGFGSGGTG